MQKLIAKYGAAAHLAILAVAPLFLFPFVGVRATATVVLWLSAIALVWTFLEPSLLRGEALHNARERVVSKVVRDPLFWVMVLIAVFAGVRALNSGIGMAYDAEVSKWYVKAAYVPFFPGTVGEAGRLPFATSVALVVILTGCRHSLGQSARMSFLLVSSALAGLAALVALFALELENPCVCKAAGFSRDYSFVGVAFGMCLLAGTVAMAAAFERKWNKLIPLVIFSMGGTAAGAFVFAPAALSFVVCVSEFVLMAYVFVYLCSVLEGAEKFKFLVITGVAVTLGGLSVVLLVPDQLLQEKLTPFVTWTILDEPFFKLRAALTNLAIKSWLQHIWIGTGLASFSLDFQFSAGADDWALVQRGAVALPNGWLQVLVERGVVGVFVLLIPCGFLTVAYFRRAFSGFKSWSLPHPACFLYPLTCVSLVLIGFVDCSLWRADVLMFTGALWAVSARGFPLVKGAGHGQ